MAETILGMTNLEFVTITLNAVLLAGMGFAMVFAKRFESLVSGPIYVSLHRRVRSFRFQFARAFLRAPTN
jgi:hypothetical protein